MKQEQPIILKVDASAIKESSCRYRFFNNVVLGKRKKLNTISVEWGQAFHTFRKIFRSDPKNGLAIGVTKAVEYFENVKYESDYKKKYMEDITYLMRACSQYGVTYLTDDYKPALNNGEPLIERTFAFPYIIEPDIHVFLCGTMDEIALSPRGRTTIIDCKTTSLWDVKEYLAGYLLNPQMAFYAYALKVYAENYPDTIWGTLGKNGCAIMIDGIFCQGKDKILFERSDPITISEQVLSEFAIELEKTIRDLMVMTRQYYSREGTIPTRNGLVNGACETKYGKCGYLYPCQAPNERARMVLLERDFITKPYDPLNFHENAVPKVSEGTTT